MLLLTFSGYSCGHEQVGEKLTLKNSGLSFFSVVLSQHGEVQKPVSPKIPCVLSTGQDIMILAYSTRRMIVKAISTNDLISPST
jgi:hypothetical protein